MGRIAFNPCIVVGSSSVLVWLPRSSQRLWYQGQELCLVELVAFQGPLEWTGLLLLVFWTGALCLSAGRGVLRLTRLPHDDRGPVSGGNRSAASCLCTVLRRALYHYSTRSPRVLLLLVGLCSLFCWGWGSPCLVVVDCHSTCCCYAQSARWCTDSSLQRSTWETHDWFKAAHCLTPTGATAVLAQPALPTYPKWNKLRCTAWPNQLPSWHCALFVFCVVFVVFGVVWLFAVFINGSRRLLDYVQVPYQFTFVAPTPDGDSLYALIS